MNEHVNFEEEEEGIEKIDFNERFDIWFQAGERFFPEYKDQLQELGVDVPDEYWGTILSNLINIRQKMKEQLADAEDLFANFLSVFNEENGYELTFEMLINSKRGVSEYYETAEKFWGYMEEKEVEGLDMDTLDTYHFMPLFIEFVEKLITKFDSMESEDLFKFVFIFLEIEFSQNSISVFTGEIICRILDFVYPIVSEKNREAIFNYLNYLMIGQYAIGSFLETCYSEALDDESEAIQHFDTEKGYLEAIWDDNDTSHNSYVFLSTIVNAANALCKNLLEKHLGLTLTPGKKYDCDELINKFISEFNNTTAQIEQYQQEIPLLEIDYNERGAK